MQISHSAELRKIATQGTFREIADCGLSIADSFSNRELGEMMASSAGLTAAWSRGRLRNHTANQQAHARPGRAYSRNSERQPSDPINFAVIHEARTPPMSMKLLRIAEAKPRRVTGYHAARIIV